MKVYSDNIPLDLESLQGGILVRNNVVEKKETENGVEKISYEYDEVKIEFTDSDTTIQSKLELINAVSFFQNVKDLLK